VIRDPRAHLAELEKRCASAGLPVTAQRRTILQALVTRHDHPTAEQLYSAVAERLPDVSRATVYRTLDTLSDLGLLRRVAHPGSAVRFDGNTAPHHHFLCERCGSMEDLPLDALPGAADLVLADAGERVAREIAVSVHGRCAACARAAAD
jgi:Fur family peroxide stress response transcriptional regulator